MLIGHRERSCYDAAAVTSAQTELRLARLIETSRLLMGAMAPDELLRAILEAVVELLAAEGCTIALIDDTGRELAFTSFVGGARVDGFRLPMGTGIVGWVATSGQSVISNDVANDARFFPGVDAKTGFKTRSIICVPLRQHDRIIGALEALNTTSADGFTKADLDLLTAFAGLAVPAIDRSRTFAALANAKAALQEQADHRHDFVVGESPAMREVVDTARTAANARTTVLLLGESGVGKELVARAIHGWSPRADGPFVAVNCAALTPDLLESELFGHEKGAFTGAIAQKKGQFELADGGTLFLDEIGELAPHLQAKLLRVLQEREFQRVGGTPDARGRRARRRGDEPRPARGDARGRVPRGSLLPPQRRLRSPFRRCASARRTSPVLAEHFLGRYCREMNRSAPRRLSAEAMDALVALRVARQRPRAPERPRARRRPVRGPGARAPRLPARGPRPRRRRARRDLGRRRGGRPAAARGGGGVQARADPRGAGPHGSQSDAGGGDPRDAAVESLPPDEEPRHRLSSRGPARTCA